MKFSKATKEKLGFYVYGLVDPRSEQLFYVGKASANNRAFDHLKSTKNETRKQKKIKEIVGSGIVPRVDILRYGLESEPIAYEVEAAIIDSIGLENLTNEVRGHGVEYGRIIATDAERLHGSKPLAISEIRHRCIAFFIHHTYSPTLSELEIYDCTRQFWHKVSEETRCDESMNLALAVVDSVVVRAYTIEAWFPAGTTFSSRSIKDRESRWEFVGNLIDNHQYCGRLLLNIDGTRLAANQNGFTYLPRT